MTRAATRVVGRTVGGRRRLQPGDRGRRFVLGRRHHRRRSRWPVAPSGRRRGPDRAVLDIIERALAEAGFALTDVIRTRMFVTDISHSTAVVAVHGRVFGDIRPAATLVEVSALMDPSLLIEIEAEARRG